MSKKREKLVRPIDQQPVESTEQKDRAWAAMTEQSLGGGGLYFSVIKKGRTLGIGPEQIEIFLRTAIIKIVQDEDDPYKAARLMKAVAISKPEEIRDMFLQAYQHELATNNFANVLEIAIELYGKDSPEYQQAQAAQEEFLASRGGSKEQRGQIETIIKLPANANFIDLARALEKLDPENVCFEDDLWDNFDADLAEKVLDLIEQGGRGAEEKLANFFRRHGYLLEDIETYLPIKFL